MKIDASRFIRAEAIEDGQRYRVGPGDKREGVCGQAIAIIALKHSPGYEIVLHLDSGKQDSFAPMQLFPEISDRAAGRE